MAVLHGAYSNSLNEILVRLLLIGFIILLLLHSCSYVYSFICCCLCVCELFRLQSRYDFHMLLFSCVHTGQPFRGRNCQSHSLSPAVFIMSNRPEKEPLITPRMIAGISLPKTEAWLKTKSTQDITFLLSSPSSRSQMKEITIF